MEPTDLTQRLSSIKTHWTTLFRAHQGESDADTGARQQLLLRYYGAVYRYLLGIVRDPAAAEDLTQEFAVRFLRGDFRRAAPERGRFRDFLKTAVRHLAMDYWRQKEKASPPLPPEEAAPAQAGPSPADDLDQPFLDKWREELLARSWDMLKEDQEKTGHPYHLVLRLKSQQPGLRSAQLAARLSRELGKSVSEEGVRQLVHRARRRFADLLVEEVGRSLQTSDPEAVAEELIELGLLSYCRPSLDHKKRSPGKG